MRTITYGAALMWLTGCALGNEKPLGGEGALGASASTDGAVVGTQGDAPEQATLDVLFVIDNSGSMASEQLKLASQIPRMVAALTSGDRYATREQDVPPGLDDKARRFTPVRSLHLGVVSTNFGGLDQVPPSTVASVASCAGTGDSGRLQNSVEIATSGVVANRNEFQGYEAGAQVIPPAADCALGNLPLYQSFHAGDDPLVALRAFSCTARLGVRGCPFEQPLESMWNALAPSSGEGPLFQFNDHSLGNGDRYNDGFLRPGAALAVVLLTDEDDCSITDEGKVLFSLTEDADAEYGDLNLRCMRNGEDQALVRPVERYVSGLLSLKAGRSDRVVFTLIAGLPVDARNRAFDALLSDPALQHREDPNNPGFPVAACTSDRGDYAFPARRLVDTARQFPNALAESICVDDYAPVVDALVNKIAPLMGP